MRKMNIRVAVVLISIIIIILLSFFLFERSREFEPEEIILAKVGDKTISLSEFNGRAEYTIRPRYCNGSNNIHKKIVLNSLIAEKMFASEAGDTNDLMKSKNFQRFIEGRKQQAMRQWLFHKEGFEKVKIDTSEIKKVFQIAGRKYRVNYFSIDNDSIAEIIGTILKTDSELFSLIYFDLSGLDTIPVREVDYNIRENDIIHDALFSDKHSIGEVIGPLKTGDGSYIVMRVDGWTDSHVFSESEVSRRWNDVKEDLTNQKALGIYEKYVARVMKGKKLDFSTDTFNKLVHIVSSQYFAAQEKEKDLFLNRTFDKEIDDLTPDFEKEINDIIDEPLLNVNGKIWTVRDFGIEVEIHPLVYRNKKMAKNDFVNQFRLAMADMIRDKYLAEEAYKKGYDQVNLVKRNVEMWRDANIALYHKNKYLNNINPEESDPLVLINTYLNPYVDELQQKYSDIIKVNVEEFDKIKLTRVDMFATQSNVPFPVLVPSFPQITTDHKLDYGKRMETQKTDNKDTR